MNSVVASGLPEPLGAQDALAHRGMLEEVCDLLIETRDDGGRRAGRSDDGKPAIDDEARQRLADGGKIFHPGKAPLRADGDAAQLAGLHERVRRSDGRDHQLNGSGCDVLQHAR